MAIDQAELKAAIDAAEEEWFTIWVNGPEVTRWDTVPLQPGDPAPAFTLPDQHGTPTSLADLIADGPALILFWRHFGCGCGVDRAARLRDELATYRSSGGNPVIVGQGVPIQAAAYAEEHDLDLPILTDKDRTVYRAYGLLDAHLPQVLFDAPNWLWSYSEDTAQKFMEARRASGRRLVNNPWTLPGEFVVGGDGVVRHAHRFQYCEDFPDPRVHQSAIVGDAVVEE